MASSSARAFHFWVLMTTLTHDKGVNFTGKQWKPFPLQTQRQKYNMTTLINPYSSSPEIAPTCGFTTGTPLPESQIENSGSSGLDPFELFDEWDALLTSWTYLRIPTFTQSYR